MPEQSTQTEGVAERLISTATTLATESKASKKPTSKKTKGEKTFDFMIGADPEFLIFHGSRAIDASAIMKTFFNKKLKFIQRPHGSGYVMPGIGEFGWDGAASTAELRPEPSNSPEEIVNRLGTMIGKIHQQMPFLDYTTLCIGNPIGGHIILDAPESLLNEAIISGLQSNEDQKREMNRITKLLASFIMPIIASEHRVSSNSRFTTTEYGRADDTRWELRGPKKQATLEVRGMSAEWLTSPKIAHATICYLAVVWHELLKNNQNLIKEKAVLRTKGHIAAVQQLVLSDYRMIETPIINGIAKVVRNFELYPKFKEECEYILHPRQVMRDKEIAGWNISNGWKVSSQMKQATKKDLFSEKKISEKLKSGEVLALEQGFHVPYNDDYRVGQFAKAISDRVAGVNWKLDHEYFLYGLKKGIKGYTAMRILDGKFLSIPENNDKKTTQESALKMAQRYQQEVSRNVRIDPKTGKTRQWGQNQIVIGIPYDIRADQNITSMIELLWDIEKKKLIPKDIKEFPEPKIDKKVKEEVDIEKAVEVASRHSLRGLASNEVSIDREALARLEEAPAI